MINDSNFKYVVSNFGWVDKGNLWIYNSKRNNVKSVRLSDAHFLSIHKGVDDYFSVGHNFNDNRFEITVHHFSDPAKAVCILSFNNFKSTVVGDINTICHIPKYYIANLNINNEFKFHLFRIENNLLSIIDDNIKWYYEGSFDFSYQGLIGVTEYKDELIFCVQRDGSLYRYSLISNKIIERISLANRSGNPRVTFSENFTELWVDDYDTILKVNPVTWKVENYKLLQPADKQTGQFLGSYSINKDSIIVARPFSSDVLILDKSLNTKLSIKVGKQPLEAVIFDKLIVAREWKTGDLITEWVDRIKQDINPSEKDATKIQKLISWFKNKTNNP